MELIKVSLKTIEQFNTLPLEQMITCIGEFDGIHIAHQELFNKTLISAQEKKLKSCVITFYPHPDYVLKLRNDDTYLTPLSEKEQIISSFGFDYLIVINFDLELASLNYQTFFELFLKRFEKIVVGFDFSFGSRGTGKVKELMQLHKNVCVVNCLEYNNKKIGSELIRQLLNKGNIKEVNYLLGRNYYVRGIVSGGSRIGRKIGYPTANISIDKEFQLFKEGVYAIIITIESIQYLGIANFGTNPSFNKVDAPRLEVFIFNFNSNIYNDNVKVELLEYIREEKTFKDKEEFKEELQNNCKYVEEKYGENL